MQQHIDILKQYVLDNDITIEQLRSVTKNQVQAILGVEIEDGYFSNLREHVRKRVIVHRDQVSLQGLKNRLTNNTWLASNYPDAEFTICNRVIKIWLDGFPEIPEDD